MEAISITRRTIATSMINRTTTIALSLLLMIPAIVGTVNVWADNIFGRGGNDNLLGRGGDDYIEGNDGNDRIRNGLGSDNIWAGNGDDTITLDGVGEEENNK